MLLFIIFFLLNILYIIFGYMISLISLMIYDSPNSGGFYTDFFFIQWHQQYFLHLDHWYRIFIQVVMKYQ